MANVFAAIGNFFKKVFGFVIKSDPFKQLVSELMPIAIATAAELAKMANLSNAEKRAALFKALVDAAKSKGLSFAEHMINLILELAVAKVKGTIAVE